MLSVLVMYKRLLVDGQIDDTAKARGISREEVIRDVILHAQPTKEFVETDQISDLVLFLASNAAASITRCCLTHRWWLDGTVSKRSSATLKPKSVNLALQGGGAHGAFTWGVLDCLLQDQRIAIEGVSGTSAGAMNAVVLLPMDCIAMAVKVGDWRCTNFGRLSAMRLASAHFSVVRWIY